MAINISDNSPRVSYTVAQGQTQTSFAVTFIFFDDADLNVYVDGVLKTLSSDYTVTGGDGATGTVTISVTGASGGSSVVVTRSIALERTSDFPTSGPFQVDALNTELDRLTGIVADLEDKADRGLQLTDYDLSANLVLPDLDGRKGRTLAFNEVSGAVEAGPTISDVQTVSVAAADIATLADIEDGTDATDAIQTVAGISGNVTTVAGVSTNVTTVAGNNANVTTVATNIADVNTTATNIADVNTAASNITEIQNASTNAATATTKAAEAATSATNAATSETNSATSATNAATSATNAATSESNAATSATNASTSETNAANSATAAAASQTAAANSAAAAASAFENFDDTYLGSKTSDPTVDNDGDPLTSGDLYFNSTANEMRVYDGANWIAATSAGNVSLLNYSYTATSGQTTFSGADDNAASLSYTVQNLIVTFNGIVLEDGTDYTATSGTSIVLATGAAAGDELNIIAFKSFTTADMVPASTGGTFSGNVTMTADLTVDTDTLHVDSTNNRVGINDIAPSSLLQLTQTSDDATGGLQIRNTADNNSIYIYQDGNVTTYDAGSSGEQAFKTANTEAMRIDSSGNVGIGTSSPSADLDVASSNATIHLTDTDDTTYGEIRNNGGTLTVASDEGQSATNSSINFRVDASEAMRIDSSGNVGIGTSSPAAELDVVGAVRLTNASNAANFGTLSDGGGLVITSGNSNPMYFYTGGSEAMRIDGSGNLLVGATSTAVSNYGAKFIKSSTASTILAVHRQSNNGNVAEWGRGGNSVGSISVTSSSTSYNTSSDHRLKTDAQPITGASARVQALNPVNFEWIADGTRVDGFLAHEAQEVVPEAVTGTKDAVDADGNPEYQGIDQSKLVPLLTAALQEAIAKIETLETEMTSVKSRLDALENPA